MAFKLYTHNLGGNIHEAARWVNKRGWAEYLLAIEGISGNHTMCVFRMPLEMVNKIREEGNHFDINEDDPPKREPTLQIIEAEEVAFELVKHFAEHGYRDNRYNLEIDGKEIPRYDGQRFFLTPMSAMDRFAVLMTNRGGYGSHGTAECYRWVDGVKLERQWAIVID